MRALRPIRASCGGGDARPSTHLELSDKRPRIAGASRFHTACQDRASSFRFLLLLRWRDPLYIIFERLAGFFDEVGIERANLGCLSDKAPISVLEVNMLELYRLLHRLGAEQLFKSLGGLFEGLLRIVGDLGRDRLHTVGDHTKRLHRRIGILVPELCISSKFLTMTFSFSGLIASLGPHTNSHMLHCTMNQLETFAPHKCPRIEQFMRDFSILSSCLTTTSGCSILILQLIL